MLRLMFTNSLAPDRSHFMGKPPKPPKLAVPPRAAYYSCTMFINVLQKMPPKRKHHPSYVVEQGARVLGRISGRQAAFYACSKAGGIIALESPGERTVAQLASIDPRVVSISVQPFTLDIASGRFYETRAELEAARRERQIVAAGQRDYTPDFGFLLSDSRRIAIEVKDPRYPGDGAYRQKLEAAQLLLHGAGWEFLVFTLRYDPNDPLVFNASLLATARHSNTAHLDMEAVQDRLEQALGDAEAALGDVLALVSLTMRDAPALFVRPLLKTDLRKACLNVDSIVSLAWGQLEHFQILPL